MSEEMETDEKVKSSEEDNTVIADKEGGAEATNGENDKKSSEKSTPAEKAEFPEPVKFWEDDPKKGYTYIILTVPELQVPWYARVPKASVEPVNGQIDQSGLTSKLLHVKIKVQNSEGKWLLYEYKKDLPGDCQLTMKNSKVVPMNGEVKLRLCRANSTTWGRFRSHFCDP